MTLPLAPRQDVTLRCQAVRLETGIDQHLTPVAEVLYGVGVHIRVHVLQAVDVSRLMRTLLLFQQTDILMGDTLLWAEQKQIGFAWALSIRHHDFRRNRRLHDDP